MWRKTRSQNSGSSCRGCDANRNFDYEWMAGGASTNPCSETFAGSKAFSEPETRALADFITSLKTRVKLYIAAHSYSQVFLYPWVQCYMIQ